MGLPSELWGLSKLRYFNVSHNALRTLQELKVDFSVSFLTNTNTWLSIATDEFDGAVYQW